MAVEIINRPTIQGIAQLSIVGKLLRELEGQQ